MRRSTADQDGDTAKVDLSEILLRAAGKGATTEVAGERDHSHRSGTRPIAQEVAAASDDWTFDPHNAVTRVQEAISLDSLTPPTVEVTVAVSGFIAVGEPSPAVSAPLSHVEAAPAQEAGADAPIPLQGVHVPRTKARSRSGARRVVATLLVTLIMGGAFALLVVAARRGHIHTPAMMERLVEKAARLVH